MQDKKEKNHGRPVTVQKHKEKIKELFTAGLSKSQIARELNIGIT